MSPSGRLGVWDRRKEPLELGEDPGSLDLGGPNFAFSLGYEGRKKPRRAKVQPMLFVPGDV